MEDKEVYEMLSLARTRLILDHTFFGMMALRLNWVEKHDIPTAAVDGKNMFYNPNFIRTLPPPQKETLLAHEAMHPMLDHIGRRAGRQPHRWNCAGDYVINPILLESGLPAIDGWLYDKAYLGMNADEVYSRLPEDCDGPGGKPGPYDLPGLSALDDIMDGDPNSKEIDALEWKAATINAANTAKQMGELPGSLQRFVEHLVAPRVDWQAILRRFISENAKNDYSFARLNRFYIHFGYFLPSLYSEAMGVLVVVVDTSGSIDDAQLQVFGSETKAIVATSRPSKLYVIYCDSKINHVDEFEPYDEIKFKMHGGGGTNFNPPFEYVAEQGINPVALVYLTDCEGPFPETPPPYPTLWCCTTDIVAPFGETVPLRM